MLVAGLFASSVYLGLGSIEYAAKEAAADTEKVSKSHEPRIRLLEALAGVRDPDTVENDSSGM